MRNPHLPQFYRWLCLAALLLACLPACTTLGVAEKPVALTFGFPFYDQAYYQNLLPAFKKQAANITIELHPMQSAPGQFDFKRDVFVFNWEALANAQDQIVKFAKPLDILLETDLSFKPPDFYPGALEAFKNNGKTIAIPAGLDPWVMYYNSESAKKACMWGECPTCTPFLRNFELFHPPDLRPSQQDPHCKDQ